MSVGKLAIKLVGEAGDYAMSRFGKRNVVSSKKSRRDLVTDVDKKCEKMIMDGIKRYFPDHSILAEESGGVRKGGKYCWVIDPIDGTTNYAHGFPFFCVSVAVMGPDEDFVAAAVNDPARKEMFTAEKGSGAFLSGRRIRVSDVRKVESSLLATGFAYQEREKVETLPYFERMMASAQAIRRAGSAALDLCYVACGRFDGFWEFGLSPWDTAAAKFIVEEAGGKVTDLTGKKFSIFQKEIVASNGRIHSEMLSVLR